MRSTASFRLLRLLLLPALLAATLVTSSCETGFEPFDESDYYFSIFGYLDSRADTQFVRVTPLRDSLEASPAPFDGVVTLQDLSTGATTTWQDSVFIIQGRVAHLFWSAQPIESGQTYRFSVERSDGAASTATVALPDSFRAPLLRDGGSPGVTHPVQSIVLRDIQYLAALDVTYYVQADSALGTTMPVTISYLKRAVPGAQGLLVGFDAYDDLLKTHVVPGCPTVVAVQVDVAAATADWPDFTNVNDETLALLGTNANVKNGVGLLGGIASMRIPWPEVLG
ncbi:MAG TPA: hypothetical protein VFG50_16080, partial [Rhodothermales bacterium]|nr:hypothetical protein [Rhodothermales bacterium]